MLWELGIWVFSLTLGSAWVYRKNILFPIYSCVQLFVTPWTEALQTPLSEGFTGQEWWSGLPCTLQEDLSDSGERMDLSETPGASRLSLVPPEL